LFLYGKEVAMVEKSKEEITVAIIEVLASLSKLDLERVLIYARALQ